jgi:uncharacterized protein (DUF1778 family)
MTDFLKGRELWALVNRAAAALNMTPEAFILEASVASAIKLLPDRTEQVSVEALQRPT